MPSFDTPAPISVTAHVGAGSIQFTAGDRADTVVEVRPSDPERDKDVRAAEQTEVAYAGGALIVRTRQHRFVGPTGSVEVTVDLPAGSRLDVTGSWTRVVGEGSFGPVEVRTSGGDVRLDTTGPLRLATSHSSITVDRVEGAAEITASFGGLRIGSIDGPAVLKNSHGTTAVGTVTGDLRVSGAHGAIEIEHADGSVTATTAHGAVRVADAARGTVQLETAYGAIDIGIREGTAAWLDVSAEHGQVRNALADSAPPREAEDAVEVRARTRWGNIGIHHAAV